MRTKKHYVTVFYIYLIQEATMLDWTRVMNDRTAWQTLAEHSRLGKKMGDFIEPGTHRSTNIKVKIETL